MTTATEGQAHRNRLTIRADYWIDRETWSSYLAFLLLVGLALFIALPYSVRIGELSSGTLQPNGLFPVLYVIVYGIVAVTLGQAEAGRERSALSHSWRWHWLRLLARQALAIGLTIPYWTAFLAAYVLPVTLVAGIAVQLLLYGLTLGLFGWRLALTRYSDIVQFNVKYLTLILLWMGSLFVPGLLYLNPFGMVQRWLSSYPEVEAAISGGLWLGLAAALSGWTWRAFQRQASRASV